MMTRQPERSNLTLPALTPRFEREMSGMYPELTGRTDILLSQVAGCFGACREAAGILEPLSGGQGFESP